MIPYIGGKNAIVNWVIDHFPENYEKNLYCEVFGGAGWVLLKKQPSANEVYNDLNADLVNLFSIIRDHRGEFIKKARWTFHSRKMWADAKAKIQNAGYNDATERAICYAILRTMSFSGNGHSYGYTKDCKAHSSWNAFLRRLIELRDRFRRIQIECLDYSKVIEKYDGPNTFFYLDPPYVDAEHYYKTRFNEADHRKLAEMLKNIKGKFLLSYYPHPLLDELYADFPKFFKQTVKSSVGVTSISKVKTRPKVTEMLVRNY